MAFIIVTSNTIGLLTKEWKGAGRKTILYILAGIATLILSTVIIGYGNKPAGAGPHEELVSDFKSPPDSARPGLFQECCDFFDEDLGLDGFVEEVLYGQP